jgi:hypothetical protein
VQPWARIWRRLNTLREFRGDGHTAVLLASALDPTEVEVLMASWAQGRIDTERLKATREIDEETWQQAVSSLNAQGLIRSDGTITPEGIDYRDEIERMTEMAAARPWQEMTHSQLERLWSFCFKASELLIVAGRMAAVTPVGAPWPPPRLEVERFSGSAP